MILISWPESMYVLICIPDLLLTWMVTLTNDTDQWVGPCLWIIVGWWRPDTRVVTPSSHILGIIIIICIVPLIWSTPHFETWGQHCQHWIIFIDKLNLFSRSQSVAATPDREVKRKWSISASQDYLNKTNKDNYMVRNNPIGEAMISMYIKHRVRFSDCV